MSALPVAWRRGSPHVQTPRYGAMWEHADVFCRKTWTGLLHFSHLNVRTRAGLSDMISLGNEGSGVLFICASQAYAVTSMIVETVSASE